MAARTKQRQRLEKLVRDAQLQASDRKLLIALVCKLHCEGKTADEIKAGIANEWPAFAQRMNREDTWSLIRAAAKDGRLHYAPPIEDDLAEILANEHGFDPKRISVVHSPALEHVARHTAERLMEMIAGYKSYGKRETVEIGFAGGRLLRMVAQELAILLRNASQDLPQKIVFHAMVAAFSDDDFAADPNNFITYFIQEPLPVEIGFVPMAAPGIVETELRPSLRRFREIAEVYKAAQKLDIIVSSAGDWKDEHSTAQAYLQEVDIHDTDALNAIPAIGDLLWQPISDTGPIDMDSGDFNFRPNTLVDLKELPEAIQQRKVRVLLALGPCGKCGKPKGNLLHSILNFRPALVTDVATCSPNVYDALRIAWKGDAPSPEEPPRRPR